MDGVHPRIYKIEVATPFVTLYFRGNGLQRSNYNTLQRWELEHAYAHGDNALETALAHLFREPVYSLTRHTHIILPCEKDPITELTVLLKHIEDKNPGSIWWSEWNIKKCVDQFSRYLLKMPQEEFNEIVDNTLETYSASRKEQLTSREAIDGVLNTCFLPISPTGHETREKKYLAYHNSKPDGQTYSNKNLFRAHDFYDFNKFVIDYPNASLAFTMIIGLLPILLLFLTAYIKFNGILVHEARVQEPDVSPIQQLAEILFPPLLCCLTFICIKNSPKAAESTFNFFTRHTKGAFPNLLTINQTTRDENKQIMGKISN